MDICENYPQFSFHGHGVKIRVRDIRLVTMGYVKCATKHP